MKKIIISAAISLFALPLFAQNPKVNVTSCNAKDNSLIFNADIDGYGTFTIRLNIRGIQNHDGNEGNVTYITTCDKSGEIFSIPPKDASKPVSADFTWDWINGTLDAAPDLGFVYRLPVANGKSTLARSITPAEVGMMRVNASGFRMWEFTMEANDPVFAVRKGTVIYVDGYDGHALQQGGNMIKVEHADGTIALYSFLGEGSAMVAPGDTIYPDTQIALAGTLPGKGEGMVFGLFHYVTNRNTAAYPNMMAQDNFINPLFMTVMGSEILIDGITVTARTTKKLLNAEAGEKNFWQRLFGR